MIFTECPYGVVMDIGHAGIIFLKNRPIPKVPVTRRRRWLHIMGSVGRGVLGY